MKKFYLILLIQIVALITINAQNILIVGQSSSTTDYDAYMSNHIQIVADVVGTIDGSTVTIQDADVVTSGSFDFSVYDAIVITEAAGSSTIKTIGTYTDDVVKAIPVLNMKTYSIHDGKGGWDWCPQDDFITIELELWDSILVEEQAVMLVTDDHPILSDFSQNDELVLFESVWKAQAHFQALSFDNSADADILSNATSIGASPFILDNTESGIGEMLWVIEENSTCMRNVIFGVHAQFGNPTDAFKTIIKNSVLWLLDIDIIEGVNEIESNFEISAYPNPTNDIFNISCNLINAADVNIAIYDVTGKEVYSYTTPKAIGLQVHSVNVSNYADGLYILKVSTEDKSQQFKLFKQ